MNAVEYIGFEKQGLYQVEPYVRFSIDGDWQDMTLPLNKDFEICDNDFITQDQVDEYVDQNRVEINADFAEAMFGITNPQVIPSILMPTIIIMVYLPSMTKTTRINILYLSQK